MAPTIAFVGLGLMGQAITLNLADKGVLVRPLILFNRKTQTAIDHSEKIGSSIVAETLSDAVDKADIIWSCVQDQHAVKIWREILSSKLDIRGKLIVESSTISPENTSEVTSLINGAGAEVVAMPLFGDPSLATAGRLTCAIAGPRKSIARIEPYLQGVIATETISLADQAPAQASLLKFMGNVLIMSTMEMVAEASVFAELTGLGTANAMRLFEKFRFEKAARLYAGRMVAGKYQSAANAFHETTTSHQSERGKAQASVGKPMVELSNARALTAEIAATAHNAGAALPAYQVAIGHLAIAERHAGPTGDITGIYGAVRVESGLEFGLRQREGEPGEECQSEVRR